MFAIQLVAKAGLTVSATFNYQLLPEVTFALCYKQSKLQVQKCIGIYHQWKKNTLDIYVWYAWRGWCGWFVSQCFNNELMLSNSVKVTYIPQRVKCITYQNHCLLCMQQSEIC